MKNFKFRIFDILLCLTSLPVTLPLFVFICVAQKLCSSHPVFYFSTRAKYNCKPFTLIKFRTMTPTQTKETASGGHQINRINRQGRFLRKYRLDELPQLWNIFCGDMSFVGPRPPLLKYVDSFPEIYQQVLTNKPGITGLATLRYHQKEATLLSSATSARETERLYISVCIPHKARIDIFYNNRKTVCFDLFVLFSTLKKLL